MVTTITFEDMRKLQKLALKNGKTKEEMASFLLSKGCLTAISCRGVLIFRQEVKQPREEE